MGQIRFPASLFALFLLVAPAGAAEPEPTPIGAPIPGAVALDAGAIVVSNVRPLIGKGVHLAIDPDSLAEAASAAGVDLWAFRREAEYYWRFSDSAAEDYPFTALPPDMRTPRTAGTAAGPFAAHVYRTDGLHTVRAEVWFRGQPHLAQTTIRVQPRSGPVYRIGIVDPSGNFGDAPRHGPSFDDIDEALSALESGAIDTLLLRHGAVYPLDGRPGSRGQRRAGYTLRDGQRIDAFGNEADGLPLIRPVFGSGGLESYLWDLVAFGDGANRRFEVDQPKSGRLAVYVEGRLQTEGVDYDTGDGMVTFRQPPRRGARILVFTARGDGRLRMELGALLELRGTGAEVRNVAISGPYDPTNPGVFDPEDLDSFEHAVNWSGIWVKHQTQDVTLFNVRISGLRSGLVAAGPESDLIVVANCVFDNWYDYGLYTGGVTRFALIGSRVTQALGALNGPGAKTENAPGVANYPDHGPVRTSTSVQQVINRSRLDSRNTWTARRLGDVTAQPVLRLASSPRAAMSYALSENHTTGGDVIFGAGGVPNQWETHAYFDLGHVQNNVFISVNTGRSFNTTLVPFTSMNNYYMLADVYFENDFIAFSGIPRGRFISEDDARTDPVLSINDTMIFMSDRPDHTLALLRQVEITPVGLRNKVGEAVLTAESPSVRIPVSVSHYPGASRYHWRIWRAPNGDEAEATAYDRPAEQAQAYRLEMNADTPRSASEVTVTLQSGRFRPGERILLTRELVRTEPVAASSGSTPDDAERTVRFSPNNRDKPVRLSRPVFRNALIAVEGDWRAFHVDIDDAPVDLAAWRSARFAPMSDLFQPLPGSSAIRGAEGPNRAARDLTGRRRPAVPTLGAIEPSSDLSAWPPLPRAPKGIHVEWQADAPSTGQPIGNRTLIVSFDDRGQPPLDKEDFAISFVDETAGQQAPSSGNDIRAFITWSHVTTGRRIIELPSPTGPR